ncbi:DoxX family protein [Silvibacterium acidisoli]|uniref:DoxX family protein n=1 Tax=Acidobacteriaceae bacterium ZG23-2 TaxID=2883246 RepID=UPI00406C3346
MRKKLEVLDRLQPWGAVILRVALSVSMAVYGCEKVLPKGALHGFAAYVGTPGLPAWLGYVAAYTEFLGGIMVIPGLAHWRSIACWASLNAA